MRIVVTLDIDFDLLRLQKRDLVELSCVEYHEALEGIVNLLDYIQDSTVDQGLLTEEQVFGTETE